ncbi:MAG: Bro-N domain-containing protein [Candidatus Fonsibacter sp.]
MSDIKLFNFNGHEIQWYDSNGEPWFRGKDVATILEYADTKKALVAHVDDDYKKKLEDLEGVNLTPWIIMLDMQYI